MVGVVEVLGGMFIRRTVAAGDMAAAKAKTQVDPLAANLQAVFTALRRRCHLLDVPKMFALRAHSSSRPALDAGFSKRKQSLEKGNRLFIESELDDFGGLLVAS